MLKGTKHTAETLAKMSAIKVGKYCGEKNPMYGRIHSEKTRAKISNALKDEKHPLFGKHRTIETRKKLSILLSGKNSPNYGKKHSIEHRNKISKATKGEKNPFYGKKHNIETRKKISKIRKKYCGKNHPFYGKHHSEETKRKLSIYCGEKNSQWKGGVSFEPYCENWTDKEYKKSILERDGHVCQNPSCRKNSKRLGIHHIDYIKKNCHPSNLITLCASCNSRANYNREYWQSLYIDIIQSIKAT